jgi:hypothetical protein
LRKVGELALASINILRDGWKPMARVRREAEHHINALEKMKGSLPGTPTDPAAIALEREIREWLLRQADPIAEAYRHAGDQRLVGAIAHAPYFVSGFNSQDDYNSFIAAAERGLFPDTVGKITRIVEAVGQCERFVTRAITKVGQRGQLLKTMNGAWELKPVVKAA